MKLDDCENNKNDCENQQTIVISEIPKENCEKHHTYDEALLFAGNGCYNIGLLATLSITLMSMLLDMFGFSVVVSGLSCDFQLSITQKGILTSMPFAGAIITSYPWGYFSDTKGRKKSLTIAMSVSFVAALFSSMSPDWTTMAVLKLVGTSFSSAAQSCTYVLLGECCGVKVRGLYMLLMTSAIMLTPTVYFSTGYFILNLDFAKDLGFLGIQMRPWRLLALILAIPLGISALALNLFYESPKFLANLGKNDEAVEVLRKISIRNGCDGDNFPVKHLVLEETNKVRKSDTSLLQSVWNQTIPIFKPPLLLKTVQLFYLIFVLYTTNNAFIVWFPFISNSIFSSSSSNKVAGNGVCELITSSMSNEVSDDVSCSSTLELQTVITGLCHSLSFTILNVIISRFASWKKTVLMLCLFASMVGGIGSTLAPNPITAMVFFVLFMGTALGMGITSAYVVDLYPTSYRGMAACLGVMVARFSSLASINLVGSIIIDHCTVTFYMWTTFVFTGVVVTWYLPPDVVKKST